MAKKNNCRECGEEKAKVFKAQSRKKNSMEDANGMQAVATEQQTLKEKKEGWRPQASGRKMQSC
jgi:hypothetical protein